MTVGSPVDDGPLAGVRVIDLTNVIAGPYATMWLGDFGADVIKIESPDGDTTRQAGHARSEGMGSVFLTLGRAKRAVTLDLKVPEGRRVVLDLCRDADVFVHNMRPEPISRLGLSYADVAAVNPRLIHATLTGFDPAGPYGDRPAYDDMIQAMTGMVDAMARTTGSPAYLPSVVIDKTVGLVLLSSILAALFRRERTGAGQAVMVPMFETATAFNLVEHLWDATFDPPVGPPGYVRVLSPHRRPYRSTDGWISALPYQDRHFTALFAAIDRPDLAADPRFRSIPARLTHIDAVCETLAGIIAQADSSVWLELFARIGVPAVAVSTLDELLEDPHLAAVGFFESVTHPSEGTLRQTRSPVQFNGTASAGARPAPRPAEHAIEVLREIGCDDRQIASLIDSGAVPPAGTSQQESR